MNRSASSLWALITRLYMGFCVAISVGLLVLWIRSYSTGDRYRSITRTAEAPNFSIREIRLGLGQGAVGIDLEHYTAQNGDAEVLTILEEAMTRRYRYGSLGYRAIPNPPPPLPIPRDPTLLSSLGFRYFSNDVEINGIEGWRLAIGVPIWMVLLLTASYPIAKYIAGVVRAQQQERLALGLCPTCGTAIEDERLPCRGCGKVIRKPTHQLTDSTA